MQLFRRSLSLVAVAVSLCAPLSGQATAPATTAPPPAPSTPPVSFSADVEQVLVDAVVTDKKGVAISGLQQSDFVVTEDGVRQNLSTFQAIDLTTTPATRAPLKPRVSTNDALEARTARSFVILFDDVHLTPFQARRARPAVVEFLKEGVREGDRVTIVATGGGAWWSARMEAGRDELLRLVGRLDGRLIPDASPERMTDFEAMRIHTFNDREAEARVRRRFESRGVAPKETGASAIDDAAGDPLVRARASEVYFQSVSRNRITLDVLERVLQSMESVRGRKSLILVSQGFIYDPNMDEFKGVVQASRRANAAIYFLDTRGLSGLPDFLGAEFGPAIDDRDIGATFSESYEASAGSESLSSDSGGFSVRNSNDLSKGIKRIADESRIYYMLGYAPSNTKRDGRFRKIQVKLARPGLTLRARKGYYAPLEGGKARERKPGSADPDIQAALDSPFERQQVPLRMTALVHDETLLGKANVLVAADVDVRGFDFEQRDGRALGTLEFLMVVAHRESGEFFRYDQQVDMRLLPDTRARLGRQWFKLVRDFELAAGGYQAKLVVRDKRSGRIGTVIHDFEVPDLAQWRASSLLLTDTLQPPPKDAPADTHPRPAVVARRDFPAGSMLYCTYEVFGAAKDPQSGMPNVSADIEIRSVDARVVIKTEATRIQPTSLGKLSRLTGSPLEGAAPGDYEYVVHLKDQISGKAIEIREPFRIVPAETSGVPGVGATP